MSTHDFLMQLFLLVITFIMPVITTFVVKFLKAKAENEKFKGWGTVAKLGVEAIEQVMGPGNGADKKIAVELWLANRLKGVSPDDINALIEAAVGGMNKTLKAGE